MMATENPFQNSEINVGSILNFISPEVYDQNFIVIFVVLLVHCFMMALTLRVLRGSHKYVTYLYFVPLVWVVAITSYVVQVGFGGMLGE
jgi:archaellum biogenesis protein FlaJ (TadC family)